MLLWDWHLCDFPFYDFNFICNDIAVFIPYNSSKYVCNVI